VVEWIRIIVGRVVVFRLLRVDARTSEAVHELDVIPQEDARGYGHLFCRLS
jgi:hypothetical protein